MTEYLDHDRVRSVLTRGKQHHRQQHEAQDGADWCGPVEVKVLWDRAGTFTPRLVKKR